LIPELIVPRTLAMARPAAVEITRNEATPTPIQAQTFILPGIGTARPFLKTWAYSRILQRSTPTRRLWERPLSHFTSIWSWSE